MNATGWVQAGGDFAKFRVVDLVAGSVAIDFNLPRRSEIVEMIHVRRDGRFLCQQQIDLLTALCRRLDLPNGIRRALHMALTA